MVPASAALSLFTVSSALETAACAEARFAASVACVTAELVEVVVLVFLPAGFVVCAGLVAAPLPVWPVPPLVPLPVSPVPAVAPVAPVAPLGPLAPLGPVGP